jgi:osmotically-inducible protein OsmY
MTKMHDVVLRQTVAAELDWDPTIDASAIGVAARDGVVTLTGSVSCYSQKQSAESAAKRVSGVRAVADELTVELPAEAMRSDAEIARSVVATLETYGGAIPSDDIQVTVDGGWVMLDGSVEWNYQRIAVESAIRHIGGVKGIIDRIVVEPAASPTAVKAEIEEALARRALVDADRIRVEAAGDTVALKGSVHSWQAKEDALHAAWSAPGVANVDDRLIIVPVLVVEDVDETVAGD